MLEAFTDFKVSFCNHVVLTLPYAKEVYISYTDASAKDVGRMFSECLKEEQMSLLNSTADSGGVLRENIQPQRWRC